MADAVVLSIAPLGPDVRVRRHVRVLTEAGLKVATITGAEDVAEKQVGEQEGPTPWEPVEQYTIPRELWPLSRKAMTAAAFVAARGVPGEKAALAMARAMPGVGAMTDGLLALLGGLDPGGASPLVLANDWRTLPAAILAHDRYGCSIHYDSHELAVAEHDSSALWQFVFPHLIFRIERAGLTRAASNSCVSPGIAREMVRLYGLSEPPLVLRNVPDGEPMPPKPPGDRIDVLYHGLFKPDRGLLRLIKSVERWPPRCRLVLRGRAPNATFGVRLAKAVQAPSVQGRVTIEPMVAADAVVCAANRADIGIFLPDLASLQNRHALPNKLFEYLGAGLMVIVPTGTDMAELVVGHCAGLALDTRHPDELPAALSRLSNDALAVYKLAAHRAAQTLTFAAEAQKLRRALGIG